MRIYYMEEAKPMSTWYEIMVELRAMLEENLDTRAYYMGAREMSKFEIGDIVEYDRGLMAEGRGLPRMVEAVVRAVHPWPGNCLYTVTYSGWSIATVRESELSPVLDLAERDPMEPVYDLLTEEPTSQYQDSYESAEVR